MGEWKTCQLGDLITFQRGHDLPKTKMRGNTYPVVGSNGIIGYHDEYTTEMPSITIGRSGNVGKPFLVKGRSWSHNTTLYIKEYKNIDPIFVFYFLQTLNLESYAGGSAVPTLNRNHIHTLEVRVPCDIKEQHKIALLLSMLDEKIDKNRTINDNLEQQAVTLFRSWFTSFSKSENVNMKTSEFGDIPENFSIVKVGSLPMLVTDYVANGSFASLKENVTLYQEPNYAYFIRNTDLKSGSFEVFVDKHSYEFLSKSTLFGGEIIISNVGDVGSVFLCPKLDGPMTLGNNIIMLRPEDEHLRYYLYIWFKHLQGQAIIQGIKGGSAQPKFNKTDFKNTSILLPPAELLTLFHEVVAPMFELISQNQAEIKRLSNIRDALLPKLMSGELDVSDIDL